MLQDGIDSLAALPADRSLEALEGDVWRAVDSRVAKHRARTAALSLQLVILTSSVAISAALGHRWAAVQGVATEEVAFSPHSQLAASTLLAGDHR